MLKSYCRDKLEQVKTPECDQEGAPKCDLDEDDLYLSDTVLVMIAKEIEYVEALTRHKSGFLFNDRKLNIFSETVTMEVVPCEYRELW